MSKFQLYMFEDHRRIAMHRSVPRGIGLITRVAILGVLISLIPFTVPGQSGPSGALTGVVRDQTGAYMPGVAITLKNIGTGAIRTVTSNEEGRWIVPALAVGTYEVAYEIAGFKKLVRDRVEVEAACSAHAGRQARDWRYRRCRQRRGWRCIDNS